MSTPQVKTSMAKYALEATLIVFSVLLALFLDEVITERKEVVRVNAQVSHVRDEMQNNLDIVDELIPYHRNVLENIDRYIASDELQKGLIARTGVDLFPLMDQGLIQKFFSISAWQLAQESQVTPKLEFSTTYSIAKAYYSQQFVTATINRLSDFVFSRDTLDPDQLQPSLQLLRIQFQELVGQEMRLQLNYKEALKSLNDSVSDD